MNVDLEMIEYFFLKEYHNIRSGKEGREFMS
jgi:hypothetical protein